MQRPTPLSARPSRPVFSLPNVLATALLAIAIATPLSADENAAPPAPNAATDVNQRAVAAARKLIEPARRDKLLSYGEKVRLARELAEGVDAVIAALKDPQQLMQAADVIVHVGVNPDANALEYLGEDPVIQAHLKPMSSAAVKLFGAASKKAGMLLNQIAQLNLNVPQNGQAWNAMDQLQQTAEYQKNMSVYSDCMATRDPPLRKSMADQAIAALNEFDDKNSGVQPRIRIMLAKLHMMRGDYKRAGEIFRTVYQDKTEVRPLPNVFEQWEARYFAIVAAVQDGERQAKQ
jgi:hypothetical protein